MPMSGRARWGLRLAEIAIGVGVVVWAVLAPASDLSPYLGCALAPPLAMAWVATQGDGWILFETRRDTLPGVGGVVTGGAIGAFLLGQRCGYLADWTTALAIAAGVGLLFGLFSFTLNEGANSRIGSTLLATLVFAGWAYGLASQVDVRLDKAAPSTEPTSMIDSFVSHGRHTSYSLRLGAWRWGAAGASYPVSYRLYRAAVAGEGVCVTSGEGALKLRWFRVGLCQTSATTPFPAGWG